MWWSKQKLRRISAKYLTREIQTPFVIYTDFHTIMEETKNAELVEEKEKKLRFKNLIIYGVEKSSSDNKDDATKSGDIYINNL